MRWPLLPPKNEIVESLGFREEKHVIWRVFYRRRLYVGDRLAVAVVPASVDMLYAGSVYLYCNYSLLCI